MKAGAKTKVTLLGCSENLAFIAKNGGLEIDITSIGIIDVAVEHMHAFKLTDIH